MNAPTSPVKASSSLRHRRRAAAGYTFVELMIAVALFAVGSGIFYEAFITNFILSAKNTALNRGNTEIQTSYFKLLTTIESAATLVDCANYDQVSQTFTPVANGTWGNSVRFMRIVPLYFYILPDDGSNYTVSQPPPQQRSVYLKTSATTVSLSFDPNGGSSVLNAQKKAVGVPAGSRLFPAFPYVTQDVTSGKSPGTKKPGLAIQSFDSSTAGKLNVTLTTALGANTFKDCNRAFLIVESAFAVIQPKANGLKSLIYIADTSLLGSSGYKPVIVSDSLDNANQQYPANGSTAGGNTAGSFCIPQAGDSVQTLLPIRSQEYGNNLKQRNTTWINLTTKFRQRQDL